MESIDEQLQRYINAGRIKGEYNPRTEMLFLTLEVPLSIPPAVNEFIAVNGFVMDNIDARIEPKLSGPSGHIVHQLPYVTICYHRTGSA